MFDQPYIVIFGAAVRPDGSPSGALRDRVGAAVRFGRRLLPHPLYIVTGAQGRYGRPECEVMAELLLQRGIRPEAIWQEPTGRNTVRSALAVARMLHGETGPVYAATSAYHLPRCVLLLGLAGLDAHRSPAAIGPASSRLTKRWYWRLREMPAIPVDGLVMAYWRARGRIVPKVVEAKDAGRPAGALPYSMGVNVTGGGSGSDVIGAGGGGGFGGEVGGGTV